MSEDFDILIVGAGPAGIAAAASAAGDGRRVGLVDDNPTSGGQIWRGGAHLPALARRWFARLEASRVARFNGRQVFDCPERGVIRAESMQGCEEFSYRKLILATGARERFLPFPGWTLPNVMGAGGLDAMVRGGLPIAGKRVVVAGTGPLLLAVATHLAGRSARILAVCEQAPVLRLATFGARLGAEPAKLLEAIRYCLVVGDKLHLGCWPAAAHGMDRLQSVTLRQGRKEWNVTCEYLACGFHLVPNIELAALVGCRIEDGFVVTDDVLHTSVPEVFCAGEPTGIGGVDLALLEGQIAGLAASDKSDEARKLAANRRRKLGFVRALRDACALDPELRALAADATIVCRCEDVPFSSLREYSSGRYAKLHTRCGMGPCQGRICGAATEFLFGWRPDSVHPPAFPALVSSLAPESKNPRFKETS
jgi:D-hydroxyproline dehydrogenase subunit alpha